MFDGGLYGYLLLAIGIRRRARRDLVCR